MDVPVRLLDLAVMHPRLLWDDIGAAAAAVLADRGATPPYPFDLAAQDIPDYGTNTLRLLIDPTGVAPDHVARIRRTYEPGRLVEFAAIAIAGLGLFQTGRHEIRDVALRGSGADYLVDEVNHLLEIAGRSRRGDLGTAWQQRWERLADGISGGYYVCVTEFETPAGRFGFRP